MLRSETVTCEAIDVVPISLHIDINSYLCRSKMEKLYKIFRSIATKYMKHVMYGSFQI